MVDNANINPDMDEYKLQEESEVPSAVEGGYNNEYSSFAGSAAAKFSRARRLFIPIILIVVIIVVYQLLSWYSNRKAQSSLNQEAVVAQKTVQSMSVPKSSVAQHPVVVDEQSQSHVSTERTSLHVAPTDMSVQQKLDILALRTESNTGQMGKMKDAIVQNQAGLVNVNRSMNTLTQSVQSLDASVKQLVANQNKAKKVKKVKKEVPPSVIYHVKAIVPGMAWLESSAGQTVTVRVGHSLPGYGVVRLISPKDGMVITSSGAVIQYGVNDF